MEEQIQDAASQMIGKYGWMFISGMLFLLFKSSMESMIEGFKVFIGDDLNTDDVVTIDAIQNDQVKNHTIEKPLPMLDLSKWECKKEKD